MRKITRRTFLKQAAFAAGAISLPARSWSQVPGANQDIRMAVIGFNGRGKEPYQGMAQARRRAPDGLVRRGPRRARRRSQAVRGRTAGGGQLHRYPQTAGEQKYRCDFHCHAQSLARPSRRLGNAKRQGCLCRETCFLRFLGRGTICCGGPPLRENRPGWNTVALQPGIQEAVEWVNNGALGNILAARGICYKRRPGIGKTEGPQPVPASVDYDLWCGPAPLTPPRRREISL